MGNAVSQPVLRDHLKLISDFAGDSKIDQDEPFWRQLLAFPVSLTQLPPSQVELQVTECCARLGRHRPPLYWLVWLQMCDRDVPLGCTACGLVCTAVSNNGRTQNFQTLLSKTLELVVSSQKHAAKASAATNALFLVRVLFKHLSESLSAVQLTAFSTDIPYTAADIQPSEFKSAYGITQSTSSITAGLRSCPCA